MKPLEIQRYNLIYRERFIKKFYYNLNEQKLIQNAIALMPVIKHKQEWAKKFSDPNILLVL